MKKILQVAGLLLGIFLLILAAEMIGGRRENRPTEALLMTAKENNADQLYVVGTNGEQSVWRPFGPTFNGLSPKGQSPDGKWVYLIESVRGQSPLQYGDVVRAHLNGREVQALAGVNAPLSLFWSPDGTWFYYSRFDQTTSTMEMYRTHATGRPTENLTANFAPSVYISEYTPSLIEANQQWVIFSAADNSGQLEVWRLWLTDGRIENLTLHQPLDAQAIGFIEDGTWVLALIGQQIYRVRPDGSDILPFLAIDPNRPHVDEGGLVWADGQQVLLYRNYPDGLRETLGVTAAGGVVQWRLENAYMLQLLPNGALVLWNFEQQLLYLALPDGSPPQLIAQPPNTNYFLQVSPDAQWVVYTVTVDMGGGIYEHQLMGQAVGDPTAYELLHSPSNIAVLEWEASALLVEIYEGAGRSLYRIGLADGKLGEKERLIEARPYGYFLGMTRLRGGWPVLAGIGGVGIIFAMLLSARRKKQRE